MRRTTDSIQDPRSKIQDLCSRLRREQSGLSTIEKIGMVALVISVLAFIPPVRSLLGDFYDAVFNAKVEGDPDQVTSGARAARGVLIVGVAIVASSDLDCCFSTRTWESDSPSS